MMSSELAELGMEMVLLLLLCLLLMVTFTFSFCLVFWILDPFLVMSKQDSFQIRRLIGFMCYFVFVFSVNIYLKQTNPLIEMSGQI